MSRIEELIKEKCPEGVEYRKISEICNISRGKVMSKDYIRENAGGYPVYSSQTENNGELGRISTYEYEGEYLTWTTDGANAGTVFHREGKFSVTNVCGLLKICQTDVICKYLFYALSLESPEHVNQGMGNAKLMSNVMADIEIPIPPIEVQREIVRILDKFTELEAELRAELDVRKKQYEYYRETMLSFNNDIEIVTLDKCADIGTGSSNTIDGIDDGVYPFFVRSQKPLTMNKFEYDEIATITAGDGVGVGKVFHFIDGKYALHQRAYRIHITDKRINPKFFHYYFVDRFPKFIFGNMYEGSVPSIRRPMLNKFEVPIPSMEEQNRIVDILDKFEEYCNNEENGLPAEIAARHKQYEYYRDKLLTF